MVRSRLAALVASIVLAFGVVAPVGAASPTPAPPHRASNQPSNQDPPTGSGSTGSGPQAAAATSSSGFPPAFINNGTIELGVNPEGHLNVDGGSQSSGEHTTWVGLRYMPTNADAISPGCQCEGWGVADSIARVSGWASVDNAGIAPSLQVVNFSQLGLDSAVSTVEIKNAAGVPVIRVRHLYVPSVQSPNVYTVYVTIENISGASIDALYRRVMDWDVEPTAFNEYVTFVGNSTAEPWLKTITNNGFDNPDPLQAPQPISGVPAHTGEGTDIGPYDHGALFDFDFGEVKPGEAVEFKIFYGAAANEAGALDALQKVQAPVYSIGEPATDPAAGTPNTFLFGFSRPDCSDILSASDATPAGTRSGKTNIKVSYDPRTLVDHRRPDWAAAETAIAKSIRVDMESAYDRYKALNLTVPTFVDVEIRCELFLAVPTPLTMTNAPAVTEADNKIKVRTSVVQEAFRAALATWNGTDPLVATAYFQNAIDDHEPFHTIHAAAKKVLFTNFFDAVTQQFGDHTNWESGAVLGSDLMTEFDDSAATDYLQNTARLLGSRQVADLGARSALAFDGYDGDSEYDAASIFQYFAERTRGHPNFEQRSADFLYFLVNSKSLREAGLRDATLGADPFDLLRDYFVTAWIRHAPPPSVTNPGNFRFLDETTPEGTNTAQPYPEYVVTSDFVKPLTSGSATADVTIKHGQGAINVVSLPAGTQMLAVTMTTTRGAPPRLAYIPFNGGSQTPPTGAVGLRDSQLLRGPSPNVPQTTFFDVAGYANVAIVVAAAEDDLSYHLDVRALTNLTPTLAVLTPGAGSFVDVRSPGLGEITLEVDPRVGGQLLPSWKASDFIVRVDGQPIRVYSVAFDNNRYQVYVEGPGGLADGLHNLSVEFRGVVVSRDGGLRVSSPNTDPGSASAGGGLGSLSQGQSAATAVTVAPGASAAAFTLAWTGSDFDLQLTSPSGRVIGETTVAPDVTVSQSAASVTIRVATPQAGSWQLRATGVTVPAAEPVTYSVQEFGTAMRAHVLVSGSQAGLPMILAVPVHDATAATRGASVWATIVDPAGVTRRFPLSDDGGIGDATAADGMYSAEAWATDRSGTYAIAIDVAASAAGAPFTRHETAQITLTAKIDTDGDGVADGAEARFGLSSSVAADGATDGDLDGLSVANELRNGTDPWSADTDRGGESDASETAGGRNPRDRADDGAVTPLAFAAVPMDHGLVRVSASSPGAVGSLSVRRIGSSGTVTLSVPLNGTPVVDGPLAAGAYTYAATLTVGGVTSPPVVISVTAGADVTPPMADLEVNDGASTTTSTDVVVRFVNATEPLAQMRTGSSSAALAAATWVPFAEVSHWQLAAAPGVQQIFAQVRDTAGLTSVAIVGGIQLRPNDTTPPVSTAGALSATYTTTTVTVPYTATDDASGVATVELWVRYRLNEVGNWGAWAKGPVGTTSPITYTFANGDGNYEFYTVAVDGAGNREAAPSVADTATRRDAVDDPPDFNLNAAASRPCTGHICPVSVGPTAASVNVTLSGSGTAVDDRSPVSVTWKLTGVKSDGSTRLIFDFKAATPNDGAFNRRIEGYTISDVRNDAGYAWYDIAIKVTAGTVSTTRTIRIPITIQGTPI